jgi:hypothetical protein
MENLQNNFSKTIEAINKDKEKKNISLFGGLIIFAMMVVDFITIKAHLDQFLTQNYLMSILMAIAVAEGLDILPAILGDRLSKSDRFEMNNRIYLAGFLVSFSIAAILIISTRNMGLYELTSQKQIIGRCIFEICLIIVTSLVSFTIAYRNDTDRNK